MKKYYLNLFLFIFVPVLIYSILVDSKILPSFDLLALLVIFLAIFISNPLSKFILIVFKERKIKHRIFLIFSIIIFLSLISLPILYERDIFKFEISYMLFFLVGIVAFCFKWNISLIFSKQKYDKFMDDIELK